MIDLGLTAAQHSRLLETLQTDHNLRIVMQLQDLNGGYRMTLTDMLVDGQVNLKANDEISRSASLTLEDAENRMGFDEKSLETGAQFYQYMIAIWYCVWRDGDTTSVDIPIFRGPVTGLDREGPLVNIELLGKESLAKAAMWNPKSYPKGMSKADVIKDIMMYCAGETKFDFAVPDGSARGLSDILSFVKEQIIWTEVGLLAHSANMFLFYDGRGILRLKRYPETSTFTFRNGYGGSILERPSIRFDGGEVVNGVWVKGGDETNLISAYKLAPASHVLSPFAMGRKLQDGTVIPQVRLEIIEDSEIVSQGDAEQRAALRLDEVLQQAMTIDFNAVPIPLLEEGDKYDIVMNDEYRIQVRIRDVSIPLVAGVSSSVGNTRNLSLQRRGV